MFFKCKTIEEAKILFKRLAKKLHPELGGEHDLMILLQEAHENYIQSSKFSQKKPEEDFNKVYDEFMAKSKQKRTEPKQKPKVKPKPEPEPEVKREPSPWDGKFIKVTDDIFTGDPRLSIIDLIFTYASKNSTFKTDFVKSVKGFLDKKDYITSSQYNSLIKVYFSFRMDEETDEIIEEADDSEEKGEDDPWKEFK